MTLTKMSDPTPIIGAMMKTITECPNHGGSFDCTPFCHICEGNQEYESDGTLPCHRFATCGTVVEEDIWREESGFCQPCQSLYYDHKLNPYTLEEEEGWE